MFYIGLYMCRGKQEKIFLSEVISSVFVKRWQPAKIATYFAFCASYLDNLVHRLYYKAVNLARFMTMSAGYFKT